MVTLEKMSHLAEECRFESMGPMAAVDEKKLRLLGEGTRHDVCASTYSPRMAPLPGICHAFTQDGRCVSLFKTLYTNHCIHQCNYCTNAANCRTKTQGFSYTPQELANITLSLYQGNYIEGLFLSSGSGGDEDRIMEKMIETARLLRSKYSFSGYIHLKILPGASQYHIQEAMLLADRVSINLEAASASHLAEICATKSYENDILQRQRYIRRFMEDLRSESGSDSSNCNVSRVLPAGQTTQLVVGVAGESDEEIFKRVLYEYQEIGVKRAYYSAFSPQQGTLFENRQAQPLWRERRLYQMDWLYRVYHFLPGEIRQAFDDCGFLGNADPKLAIAREFLDQPVDPNSASYQELLKVPGIGPKSAQRIISFRKSRPVVAKRQLAAMGVAIKRAGPFLKINGWKDTTWEMWQS
jgi:putative DNA modification/repair radical SAM protein